MTNVGEQIYYIYDLFIYIYQHYICKCLYSMLCTFYTAIHNNITSRYYVRAVGKHSCSYYFA